MGCGSSTDKAAPASAAPAPALAGAELVPGSAPAPAPTNSKGNGKSRNGKGKNAKVGRFQVKLAGEFKDYEADEDAVLKKAYLVGQPNARFHLRGQNYEYDFRANKQKNLDTNKEREIRPPTGLTAPSQPLLPTGPMVVLTVKQGQAGKEIEIDDPNNPGQKIKVNVPPGAKPGQKMAVPVPDKGETVAQVQEKQKGHSTAAKLAMGVGGVALVGGLAVGGVILGDHLTGGHLGVADRAGEIAEDAGEWAEGAAGDVADWTTGAAEDVGEWATGAAEDVGDWAGPAAEDAGEWAEGAWDDTVDWLEGAGEDVGDFVTSLF